MHVHANQWLMPLILTAIGVGGLLLAAADADGADNEAAVEEMLSRMREELEKEANATRARASRVHPPDPKAVLHTSRRWARDYDPKLAEFAMEFAAAAYAEDPVGCLERHGATLIDDVVAPCGSGNFLATCRIFFAIAPPSYIVIAARGTKGKKQLLGQIYNRDLAPTGMDNAYVNDYVKSAVDSLEAASIYKSFTKTVVKLRSSHRNHLVLFTGYSLGGEIASLASLMYAYTLTGGGAIEADSQVQLITFGQPRTGNIDYAKLLDRLVPNSWRLINGHDIVTRYPPGDPVTSFIHHGTEIWYFDGMANGAKSDYTICDNEPFEDESCIDSVFPTRLSFPDHLHYFNKRVSDHGKAGCECSGSDCPAPPVPSVTPPTPLPYKCGHRLEAETRPKIEAFINLGNETSIEHWPWMAYWRAKKFGYELLCSPSLVGERWILINGHCVEKFINKDASPNESNVADNAQWMASVGGTKAGEGRKVEVQRIHLHPNYVRADVGNSDSFINANDIALLELAESIGFEEDSSVQPICLPGEFEETNGERAWIAGWGGLDSELSQPSYPTQLQEGTVTVLDVENCIKSGKRNFTEYTGRGEICSVPPTSDVRKGDDTAPLMVQNEENGRWFVIGIVSWSDRAYAEENFPTYYTRISNHCAWIKETTGGEVQCELYKDYP